MCALTRHEMDMNPLTIEHQRFSKKEIKSRKADRSTPSAVSPHLAGYNAEFYAEGCKLLPVHVVVSIDVCSTHAKYLG